MKISVRTKITLMVAAFSIFVVSASWIVCNYMIEGVFVIEEKRNLKDTYKLCDEVFGGNDSDIEFDENFYKKIGSSSESIILVYAPERNKVYTSISVSGNMSENINRLLASVIENNRDLLTKPGNYVITKSRDTLSNSYYFDLVGLLKNGNLIVIRSPVARIDAAMDVVSKVFIWIAVGLIIFGSVFILMFSSIFSSPIKTLSKAAKRMAGLDFDVKVPVYSKDEIGELGMCMNEMSCKLERTISELKSANIKLERDIAEKQQIDDMRREFLSHVSHELKTPIALIQGYAEGLKDNLFDDEESKNFYTDVIIDEAKKMNDLVKKLLTLNEIEFGNNPLNIERFDVCELIRGIIAASKILINEVQADVVFESDAPCYVWADEYMIEEVFTNYLTNAIHYVTEGGRIEIELEKIENDIRVKVYNQGNTISDEDINMLFEKFYKADKARTREYGGSGVGLSIVAATMQAHNKGYGVYNMSDGVVFYFDLDANMPC